MLINNILYSKMYFFRQFGGVEETLGLIAGTSSCHMALAPSPLSTPGVWGPYCGAVLPSLWLLEGGQTAVGSLIDHLIKRHPAYEAAAKGRSIIEQRFLKIQIIFSKS